MSLYAITSSFYTSEQLVVTVCECWSVWQLLPACEESDIYHQQSQLKIREQLPGELHKSRRLYATWCGDHQDLSCCALIFQNFGLNVVWKVKQRRQQWWRQQILCWSKIILFCCKTMITNSCLFLQEGKNLYSMNWSHRRTRPERTNKNMFFSRQVCSSASCQGKPKLLIIFRFLVDWHCNHLSFVGDRILLAL